MSPLRKDETRLGFSSHPQVEIPNFRTKVYRKLAAQPYILPFNSAHPPHIMKNIPFSGLLRAVRICSHRDDLRDEIEKIRVTLLLNRYPSKFIDNHFKRFFETLTGEKDSQLLLSDKHSEYRERVLDIQWNKKEKQKINFDKDILLHFTYVQRTTVISCKPPIEPDWT